MDLSLKAILTILAVSMLTIGTLTPAMAVSPETYSFGDKLEVVVNDIAYEQPYVPGEILVKFKPGVSETKITTMNSKLGTSVTYTSPYAGFKKLKIPKTKSVEEMAEIYSKNPNVEYATANYVMHAAMEPNDYYYDSQWNFHSNYGINVTEAWDISNGSGVVVAVLDTGVAYEDNGTYGMAPDLAQTSFVSGWDFVNNDAHPNDDNAHGTHVAGTIAQSTNNTIGVAGVAFGCTIMPVKVLNYEGRGTLGYLLDGIEYATDNGADVISMSLSFNPGVNPSGLEAMINYAYEKNVTIVAAAGNDGLDTVCYPAAYDNCIAVGATIEEDGSRAYYSNYGDALDIMAPGTYILQQTFSGDPTNFAYLHYSGTSMATPHVAGVAALLIANGVNNPDNVRAAIENTAQDIYGEGWDSDSGYGIVDAYAALNYVPQVSDNLVPVAKMTITPEIAHRGDTITFTAFDSYDPDGNITDYIWDFGDGSTGVGVNVTHVYSADNDYLVNLMVVDNENATGNTTGWTVILPQNDAPTAVITMPATANVSETVTFDASGSKDIDGNITDYMWNFGDGSTAEGIEVEHMYDIAGNYTVTLVVIDDLGATDNTTGSITIIQPNRAPIAVMDVPQTANVSEIITFNASGSYDPDGDNISYLWNFGDGSTAEEMVSLYAYNNTGIYNVTLTVSDGEQTDSVTETINITEMPVNEPPSAVITMPATANTDETIAFNASGSTDTDGTIISYLWDFGDGSTAEGIGVEHMYIIAGNYTVTLIVIDDLGATNNTTGSITIIQPNRAPIAVMGVPQTANVSEIITFNASGSYDPDGDNISFSWDFEDGNTAEEMVSLYSYNNTGIYNVTLTVSDGVQTDSVTGFINITEVPVTAPVVTVNVQPVTRKAGKNVFAHATATIDVTYDGSPASGAVVSGHWEGTTSDSDTEITNADGIATVDSDSGKYPVDSSLTFKFVVDSVAFGGVTYTDEAWTGTGSYQ